MPRPDAPRGPSFVTGPRIRLLLTVVVLGLLASRLDLANIPWRGLSAGQLAVMGAAWATSTSLRMWRWRRQAVALGVTGPVLRDMPLGILGGVVTPGKVGELYRLRVFPADRRWAGAAALAYEKGAELCTLLLIITAAATTWDLRVAAVALAGTLATAAILLSPWPRTGPAFAAPWFAARDSLSLGGRFAILGATLGAHVANYIAGSQVYAAFVDEPLLRLAAGLPLATLAGAVPLTISGFGVRESVAIAFFADAPPEGIAAAASLTFLGANVLPWAVLALLQAVRPEADPAPRA